MKLDLSSLSDAIGSLDESMNVVSDTSWFAAQSTVVQHTIVAGVIHNFELVYDLSVKVLQRRLEIDAATPSEVEFANFRDLLRRAAEQGLISDVEAWFHYRDMRNMTAHTYDQEKAQQVYEGTQAFLSHARALLEALIARND